MAVKKYLTLKEVCKNYGISLQFLSEAHHLQLIELITIKRTRYLNTVQLPVLEKIFRLHNDLDINLAGIQTILHLLNQMEQKNREIFELRTELDFYK